VLAGLGAVTEQDLAADGVALAADVEGGAGQVVPGQGDELGLAGSGDGSKAEAEGGAGVLLGGGLEEGDDLLGLGADRAADDGEAGGGVGDGVRPEQPPGDAPRAGGLEGGEPATDGALADPLRRIWASQASIRRGSRSTRRIVPRSSVMNLTRLRWSRAVRGCQSWARASSHMVSKVVTVAPTAEGA